MLKARLLIYVVFIVLFVQPVIAGKTLISDSYVPPDSSVTVSGIPFIVKTDRLYEHAQLIHDTNYTTLSVNECEWYMTLEICYNGTRYNKHSKEDELRLLFYDIAPDITISRSIGYNTISVNAKTEFSVTISNSGGRSTKVSYIDDFPEEIEIFSTDGCFKKGNSVVWERILENDTSKSFSYIIKPTDEFEADLRAKINYSDYVEIQEEYSTALHLTVNPMLGLISKFEDTDHVVATGETLNYASDDTEFFVGDEFLFIANLTNELATNTTDIVVNYLDIMLPSNIKMIQPEALLPFYWNATNWNETRGTRLEKISEQKYRWSGTVGGRARSNSGIFFVMKLKGNWTGYTNIIINAKYYSKEDDILRYIENYQDGIDIKNHGVLLSTNLAEGEHLDSHQQKELRVWMQNPNEDIAIKDIKIIFDTDLLNLSTISLSQLKKEGIKKLIDTVFVAPDVNSETKYRFNVNVTYKTSYGERFKSILERDIYVDPIEKLSITQTLTDTLAESGEKIDVTVSLVNERNTDVQNVYIHDKFGDLAVDGVTSRKTDISAGNTVTAYKYTITAPNVTGRGIYTIETIANYTENNITYSYSKKSNLKVIPKKLVLGLTKSISDSDIHKGEIVDIDYTITNTESEIVRNIVLHFPLQKEFDLIGEKTYEIGKLDPGESIDINAEEKIRPKYNNSLTIEKTNLTYEDKYGNEFSKTSGKTSVTIKDGYIQGPAITINKTVPSNVIEHEEYEVILDIANIGDSDAIVNVRDGIKEWDLTIKAGKKETLSYKTKEIEAGVKELGRAEVTYEHLGKNVIAVSDEKTITVEEKPLAALEEEQKEEEPVAEKEEVTEKAPVSVTRVITTTAIFIILILFLLLITKIRRSKGKKFTFLEEE